MFNDLFLISFWLILLLTLTFLAFPLVWRFLRSLPDGGFCTAPVFGIVLPGYLSWLFSSLHILPFKVSAPAAFLILLISGIFTLARHRAEIKQFIREKKLILFIELIIFAISIFAWSIVRGFQPDISGLEKFMDMGFVNSILKSDYMPPADMWLSGETINYYYFGHYLTAFVTLLSGIDSAYAYNLMLATVFALSMLGSFGFVFNTLRLLSLNPPNFPKFPKIPIIVGILTAILLNFGGNLHPAWHFLTQQTKPYWYPDATRFIPYTIHEFPAYSHVVADLHGHLLDLPIVLTFLTVLIQLLVIPALSVIPAKARFDSARRAGIYKNNSYRFRISPPVGGSSGMTNKLDFKILILPGFLLGVMTMTNFWDLPIYGLVFGLALVMSVILSPALRGEGSSSPREAGIAIKIKSILFSGLPTFALTLIVSLPFHLHFKNFSQGIALVQAHSALWQLAVLWGGFAAIGLIAILSFGRTLTSHKSPKPLIYLLPLVLIFVSFLLILVPEVIYVKDIYIKEYHRANTMFKLTYQSFVMMCLVWGITLGSILKNKKFAIENWKLKIGNLAAILLLAIFAAHMFYSFYSIKSYYGLTKYRGLYGLQFLQNSYPDDYAAILWLKKNIPGSPIILEAVGESYTDHARVSSFTGLPTILGWRVHEWLWRGGFDEAGKRTEIVRKIYENPTSTETKTLLNQYQIKYIFVGDLERKAYKLDEKGLQSVSTPVFRSGNTAIYKLN